MPARDGRGRAVRDGAGPPPRSPRRCAACCAWTTTSARSTPAPAEDPDLAWAAQGAGRLLRSPTVFEDVVKTICTTNCTWSATVRMVSALVGTLGRPAVGAPGRRAFPTPAAMAQAGEDFYVGAAEAGPPHASPG